jgi:hypothetical protein
MKFLLAVAHDFASPHTYAVGVTSTVGRHHRITTANRGPAVVASGPERITSVT